MNIEMMEAIKQAQEHATKNNMNMVVVHAPVENCEQKYEQESPLGFYGYCPEGAEQMSFPAALKGIGQKDCPALGVVATVTPAGYMLSPTALP